MGFSALFSFIASFPLAALGIYLSGADDESVAVAGAFIIVCFGIVFSISLSILCMRIPKQYKKDEERIEALKSQLEEELTTSIFNFDTATIKNEDVKRQAEQLRTHAKELEDAAAKIREQLASLYSLNIIPPR